MNTPIRTGLFDPPSDTVREFARRCREPRCRDVFERAVHTAAVEAGLCRSITGMAATLAITEA
ncbi:MAG: hypothetical protein M3Q75_13480, partial [Gemmatimonadota bacterium]|nr:hypothetical protein [Gemmatimonadota bacterium]